MSTEIDNLEKRVAALEARFPAICPDPTGEGSAWQGEVARIADPHPWSIPSDGEVELKDCDIIMSSDSHWHSLFGQFRKGHNWAGNTVEEARAACGNRGLKFFRKVASPAEPAPGSDAAHPPEGYVLVDDDAPICASWLCWDYGRGPWNTVLKTSVGLVPSHRIYLYPLARPIPANEGDSQKEFAELRATVERLTAENASLEVENRTLHGLVRRMREVLL